MKTVFAVFEKLDNYYDDNDKVLHVLFSEEVLAENYVEKNNFLKLFVKELKVY